MSMVNFEKQFYYVQGTKFYFSVANNLHNLVLLALVNELVTAEQVLRNIEFAKCQTSDD